MNIKKILLSAFILSASSLSFSGSIDVFVNAVTQDYNGLKNWAVPAHAVHDIEITNNTDVAQTFNYSYEFCAEFYKCVSIGNTVTIAPHSRFNNNYNSYLNPVYGNEGNYHLSATTRVSGKIQKEFNGTGTIVIR